MSESTTKHLDAAMAKAKLELKGIPFDKTGAYAEYATVHQVRKFLNPVLATNGITFKCVAQSLELRGDLGLILVRTWKATHGASGEFEVATYEWPVAKGRNAQEDVGKCTTYMTRYVYRDYFELALGFESDPEDDGKDEQRTSLPGRDGEGSAMDARARREKEESDHDRRGSEAAAAKAAREVAEKKLFAEATALWLRLPEKLKLCEDGSERHQAAREDGCLQPFMDWARKQVAEAAAAPRETVDVGI